ncbi:MAG: spore coat protein, partial [Candidatus Omnitrophica bacterium CG07_land_8_20_14_0_80_42_15]
KRFEETRLSQDQLKTIKDEISKLGFVSICTPFDEESVDLIERHGFDIIKIGSCSFTDWPLLERIVKSDKPIIASTAGVSLDDIDKVVSFFDHRNKTFALMHCVAEYPTQDENLQLNQIDLLKFRYPQASVGYSTHEKPDNFESIKMAIAKGATIFEKHVGIKTEKVALNNYSATPGQVREWLRSAQVAFNMCGESHKRIKFSKEEMASLTALRRGAFAKKQIKKGERVGPADIFLAIPTVDGQITANDLSKYTEFYATGDIDKNRPLLLSNTKQTGNRDKIYGIVQQVKGILKKSNVLVPSKLDFEISHHYGIDRFHECGATIINVVNREYCKKLIVLIPGQKHPEQYHKLKEETFQVLYGDVLLNLSGLEREYKAGDIVTIERNAKHSFSTRAGAVIEEISSTHRAEDSYYTDEEITRNKCRKTLITYWVD